MQEFILDVKGLSVGYPRPRQAPHVVARGVNLSLKSGELVCLLGPNGVGKSTLLRTLAGMQLPLAGDVLLDGKSIHSLTKLELARTLSVVLTDRVAIGLLTSYEVVALGRSPYTGWSGTLREDDHAVIEESINAVDAGHLAHRFLGELSDGERQKIMLARALAQKPRVMILDEITAFLDLPRRVEIMRNLRDLAHRHGPAILLCTHDLELALATADCVWLMPRQGSLMAGTPEDLVLNGAFSAAFSTEGVHFDDGAGTFSTARSFGAEVTLWGDGTANLWTKRALERRGYRVGSGSHVRVTVTSANGSLVWEVSANGHTIRKNSIEGLLSVLRALVK